MLNVTMPVPYGL